LLEITKATLKDIAEMQALVRPEIEKGVILERGNDEVANTIRSYIVAREDGVIVGFCALYIYNEELGEIRSLIVKESHQRRGIGKKIVEEALKEAKYFGLKKVLALTYKKAFFESLGFVELAKEEIPDQKVWLDCIKCKHFPVCDEISLIKAI